jgi:hypothetical protein
MEDVKKNVDIVIGRHSWMRFSAFSSASLLNFGL